MPSATMAKAPPPSCTARARRKRVVRSAGMPRITTSAKPPEPSNSSAKRSPSSGVRGRITSGPSPHPRPRVRSPSIQAERSPEASIDRQAWERIAVAPLAGVPQTVARPRGSPPLGSTVSKAEIPVDRPVSRRPVSGTASGKWRARCSRRCSAAAVLMSPGAIQKTRGGDNNPNKNRKQEKQRIRVSLTRSHPDDHYV